MQRLRRLLARSAHRRTERAFVAEGVKVVAEALDAGAAIEGLYVSPSVWDDVGARSVVRRAADAGVRLFELAGGVMERVSDAATPQPVLAVCSLLDVPLADLRGRGSLVVCVGVRDPGNLGTLVRSAAASGVGGVVVCAQCADMYNPKAVRASAGSLFHVPLALGDDAGEVLETFERWGLRRLASSASGGSPYDEADLSGDVAIVVGNEACGLAPSVLAAVDGVLTIPLARGTESLNVAVAGAILCFEAARQRRQGRP